MAVPKALDTAMITVAELMKSPALQLRLEMDGADLERRIGWAHVCELEDPTPWLTGSELLMTVGLGVPRTAARQRAYVERLDDAGVAALVLSEKLRVPPLSTAFREAVRERGLPVLRLPLPVPFIAIAREVAAAVHDDNYRTLTTPLQVFGALRTLASEGLSAGQLFSRLEAISGYRLFVCSPSGRPLLTGVPAPPDSLLHLLPDSLSAAPTVTGGYVLPIPAPGGATGFLLAMEQPGVTEEGLAVVQYIATVAGLQISMIRHEREVTRRQGAETLVELMQGVLDPETVRRRFVGLGIDFSDGLHLAVVRAGGPSAAGGVQRTRSIDSDFDQPALFFRQKSDVLVVAAETTDIVGELAETPDLVIGLSRPFAVDDSFALARREALWAVARAHEAGHRSVRFGQVAAGRWLAEDADALRSLVESVIGPVISYDAVHGGSLLSSVRIWLENDKRTQDAAALLNIHHNTLAYRIKRFEQLTGRSLHSTSDLAEVWLALTAVAHTGDYR